MTSRLHIWMKPVPEEWKTRSDNNKLDTVGDFKVWADSTMPEDPRLLVTIGGSANIAVQHKQLLYGDGDPNCSQQGAPNYVLIEKKSFCRKIESTDYLRCHKVKSPPFSSSMGSSRGSSISTSSSVGSADIVEAVMNMKIGTWKNPTTGTKKQPLITCGFCYIQYKRHCQKLGKPYPMVTDPGFWIGHSAKDENGDVTCPELFKLVCPLCFATGKKAHTLKFCPLMSMARTRYHNNNYN